ncbi:MAG TPA: hypothetical protein VF533_04035 [Solirubrobacteraceae bacterium]|jgi:hypothetical protein
MSTGAIIAIAAVVLIAAAVLLFVLPRMRRSAAERRLKWEREQRASEHREKAKLQQTKAELAEQEARKQRAEAEIHAKRAELHEHGLADHELESGPSDDVVQDGRTRTRTETVREDMDTREDESQGGGRFRSLTNGGRAHEPAEDTGQRRFIREDEREVPAESEERRTLR